MPGCAFLGCAVLGYSANYWGYLYACRLRPCSHPRVPNGEQCFRAADGEQAGQMHRVGTAQRVLAGQLPGVNADKLSQLDYPGRPPVFLLCGLSTTLIGGVQAMGAPSGGQRGAHLGIGQSAGNGGIAAVPQRGGEVAAVLLDDQFEAKALLSKYTMVMPVSDAARSPDQPPCRAGAPDRRRAQWGDLHDAVYSTLHAERAHPAAAPSPLAATAPPEYPDR